MERPVEQVRADASRACLALLVAAWGAQAIVTQSLLVREALVLLFGSELVWGLVFAAWLLGVAAGGWLGGWATASARPRSAPDFALAIVLLLLCATGVAAVAVLRCARAWWHVPPGELLPFAQTALTALAAITPAGFLVGLAYPLASSCGAPGAGDAPGRGRLTFGHIYGLESAGSLVGGALFSFWAVDHCTPLQTILACGFLSLAAATGLSAHRPRAARVARVVLGSGAAACLFTAMCGAAALDRWLAGLRWQSLAPGYEQVAEIESRYQNLALGRRADQYSLYCNGQVAADFPDPYTYVPLAHFWLCQHPHPRRVLVLGGGAEGLLSEILRHPVEQVDYVEPDPRQIDLLRPFLAQVDARALGDPRVQVWARDARHYIKTQRDRFDLVIARLPEPTSAQRARFYTADFYAELRRAMTSQAVVCLTATAAPTELSALGRAYLASLRATLRTQFATVIVTWGDPAHLLAATGGNLATTDPAVLAQRYAERGITCERFDPAWFFGATDWLQPDKIASRSAELEAEPSPERSTDLRPAVYLQRLELWEAQQANRTRPGRGAAAENPRCPGLVARLRGTGLPVLVDALAVLGAAALLVPRLRHRAPAGWTAGALVLSVTTTGFASMALSIIWLFAFQNLYGYVYQRIGWIIALFMGGLVVGCMLVEQPAAQRAAPSAAARFWRLLIVVDLLLASLGAALPWILPLLSAWQTGPTALHSVEWTISGLVVLTGLLGGAAFALAARLHLATTGHTGRTAGAIVGADHAGACLGALLCGTLLVPVYGLAASGGLLAGVKAASAIVLILCRGLVHRN